MDEAVRRYFVGATTTTYQPDTGLEDLPELAGELARAQDLFVGLGYQNVPGFGPNLGVQEFTSRWLAFLQDPGRRTSDVVVMYYTGHARTTRNDLLLPMADTTAGNLTHRSLRASDLTGRLLETDEPGQLALQQFLFVVDACHAAAASTAMTAGVMAFLEQLRGGAVSPSVAMLVSTRPHELAAPGAFTKALTDAVHHRASGGHEQQYLTLDTLCGIINDATPEHQHARQLQVSERVSLFFPNPRFAQWLHGLDLRTQKKEQQRRIRETDLRHHVGPRARGVDSSSVRDDLWLFTGRQQALRHLSRWLSGNGSGTMIVTGDPGSGKSALLSRLYLLADKALHGRVPNLHLQPTETLPPLGSVDRFIHARGLTVEGLLAALGEACNVDDVTSPGALLAALGDRTTPFTVIIDAVDETFGAREDHPGRSPIVENVLAPLINLGQHGRLRLLIGTRKHLVDALGKPADMIDLDQGVYADRGSVRAYARACLVELEDASPYRHQPSSYLDAVAGAIADRAGDSFLVALITSRSLAQHGALVDPSDAVWRAGLPRLAAHAMRDDLNLRLGADAARARDLLLPLAYAEGSGLPWEDLWPALVLAVTGRSCTNADLDWLIKQAGYYIVETLLGSRSVYRLYHESLAEHLRDGRDGRADQTVIVDTLAAKTPRLADGQPDWSRAHPYTQSTLPTHAAVTDHLDALVADPRFLLGVLPAPLLPALAYTASLQGSAAADAYRRAATRIRTCPPHERAAYLQLAARCARAPSLASAISESGLALPFATDWASWRLQPPHHTLAGHIGSIWSVTFGQLDGRDIIVSGGDDGTVRLWDAAASTPMIGHVGPVFAVAAGRLHGRDIIVSAGDDGTIRLWDTTTATPIAEPMTGHTGCVRSVAVSQPDGRDTIVSGGDDGTIRLWDTTTATPIAEPMTGHTGPVWSVAITKLDGRDTVVSGGGDGTIRLWDTTTATPMAELITRHTGPVNTVSIGQLDGRTVIVSGGDDGTVLVTDLVTGIPVGDALTGHTSYVWSATIGRMEGQTIIVSVGSDATVRLWDAATGTPIGDPFTGHTGPVWSLAVGQVDEQSIVVSGGGDGTVRLWDAATGAALGHPLTGHTGPVYAVAAGRLGEQTIVVSGGDDSTVRLWDAATGAMVGHPLAGHIGSVRAVAAGFLQQRAVVAAGGDDGTLRVWDAATGAMVGEPARGHSGPVNSVTIGQLDEQTVIVTGGADGTVRVWDAACGTPIGVPFTGHIGFVMSVSVGQLDGRTIIASGSSDGSVRVWYADSGTLVGLPFTGHASHVYAVAVGRLNGQTVVVSGGDYGTLQIWNAASGTLVGAWFTGHTNSVYAVAIGPLETQTIVVSAGDYGTVRVWDAAVGTPLGDPFTGHNGPVNTVAVGHLDGRPIIASGGDDGTMRVWEAASGTLVCDPFSGHSGPVNTVAVSGLEGRTIIAAAAGGGGEVRVWDAATGEQVGQTRTSHTSYVWSVAIGQLDEQVIIASGDDDGAVHLWDATDETAIAGPPGGSGSVYAVAMGRLNGHAIVAYGGSDGTVRVWNMSSKTLVGSPISGHHGPVYAVAVGQFNGQTIVVTGGDDGTVRLWDATTGAAAGAPLVGHNGPVRAVALGQLNGRAIVVSGGDRTVRIWDPAPLFGDLPRNASVPSPESIDVAAAIYELVYSPPGHIVVSTELGVVSIRLPTSPQLSAERDVLPSTFGNGGSAW